MTTYPCVLFASDVTIKPSPGGVVLLAACLYAARKISHSITITAGSNGTHSGPEDPHYKGDALDARTHDLPDKYLTLGYIKEFLEIPPDKQQGDHFFIWIEDENQPNEHFHMQVRKGTIYPPLPLTNAEAVQDASAGEN